MQTTPVSCFHRVITKLSSCGNIFSPVILVNIIPLTFKAILRVKSSHVMLPVSWRQGVLLLIFASITAFTGSTSTFAPFHNTYHLFKSKFLAAEEESANIYWVQNLKGIFSKLNYPIGSGFMEQSMQKYRDSFSVLNKDHSGVKWKWIKRRIRLESRKTSWDMVAIIQEPLRGWRNVVIGEEQRKVAGKTEPLLVWGCSRKEGFSAQKDNILDPGPFSSYLILPILFGSSGNFPKMQTTQKIYKHLLK